jgi:hypothetical protein
MLLGILISYTAGTFLDWNRLALVSFFLLLPSFPFLYLCPDSPHWLLSKPTPNEENAIAVLYKLKGKSQAEDDLRMIRDQSNQRLAKISNNHPIISTDNGFRTAKPFLLSVSLICLQQLSGESCHLKTNLIFRTIDNHYFISVQSYILINEYKWVF